MKNKIMSMLVVLTMVLSGLMVMNTYDISMIDNVKATRKIINDSTSSRAGVILSNDGSGDAWDALTCGELITLYVVNNSLIPDEDYAVKVWNGSAWVRCYDVAATDNADDYGDLAIQFHVPGWSELGVDSNGNKINPIINGNIGNGGSATWDISRSVNGTSGLWNISLWTEETGGQQVWGSQNITITIGNLYDVYFTRTASGDYDDKIDHLTYGEEESFYVQIRNWTGNNGWQEDYDGSNGIGAWNLNISEPIGGDDAITPKTNIGADNQYVYLQVYGSDIPASPNQYEYNYWVNVSKYGTWDLSSRRYSNVTLPVKLNVTANIPTSPIWGDTLSISGTVTDANNTGINAYTMALYAPVATGTNGSFTQVHTDDTYADGSYAMTVDTGPDTGYGCGTWYLGTYETGSTPTRIDEADTYPFIRNFITYHTFEVATKTGAVLAIQNADDIVADFNQTINVSVRNASWMNSGAGDAVDEYQNMVLHITGLNSWNQTTRTAYDDDDIVAVTATMTKVDANEKYAYYSFTYHFNETGTATVIATWPGNGTSIMSDEQNKSYDSTYSNTYNAQTQLLANISGSTTFSVVSPSEMNLIIAGTMVDSVNVNEVSSTNWINQSQSFNLTIYGDSSSEPMNATIEITGCGLDITIEESDTVAGNEYLTSKGNGWYVVTIQPKTAGTLTITATNGTEGTTTTHDYTITGLTGSVTTSEGDDTAITVGTTETITATVSNGQFSEVKCTMYDSTWTYVRELNSTVGDGTEGEGLNGIFTFRPDVDDIDRVGYIIVVAKAGSSNYMYEVIEIAPIYDLTLEMVNPVSTNQTLTVGLEQDFAVQLLRNGETVEDDTPTVVGKLIDDNHNENDPLQTITFSDSGDEWEADNVILWYAGTLVITGYNASTGVRHEGNVSIEVGHATLTYSPDTVTAGIGKRNVTITVTAVDANGDPLAEGTHLYMNCEDSEDAAVNGVGDSNSVNFKSGDDDITVDEDGVAEFVLTEVGDNKTSINATLQNNAPSTGNRTLGKCNVVYPTFTINPDTIYIGQSNVVTITAKDNDGNPIQGINITLLSSNAGIMSSQPDPVETNADGQAQISLSPDASGTINVTLARNIRYINGLLNWTNSVVTDSTITVTAIQTMKISLSKSPIYEGQTLTVTVTSGTNTIAGVDVEFGETTVQTDSNGQAEFTAPDPGVESAVYTVSAEKAGYVTAEKSITVIKIWDVLIVAPSSNPGTGEQFTITILAKGQALAGATIEFNGKTYTSNADGELTITAPNTAGDYTITASYEDYNDATVTITIKEGGGVPGFELLSLLAALGVAFILLRRRR